MHRGTADVAKELLAAPTGDGGRAFDELEWARWFHSLGTRDERWALL